jgi:hypothetical protein
VEKILGNGKNYCRSSDHSEPTHFKIFLTPPINVDVLEYFVKLSFIDISSGSSGWAFPS